MRRRQCPRVGAYRYPLPPTREGRAPMRTFVSTITVLAALMIGGVSTQAATTDPQVQIYRFSGVKDSGGGAGTGVATSFHCTNFSGVTETLRVVGRNFGSTLVADLTINVGHNQTRTMSTHDTAFYSEDLFLNTGIVNQGGAR